ncbi:MAG: hypothetical protein IKA82_02890 [Clostridia bacterium]|nr:hypothetical protein [Clostridia bacterium]
MGFGWLFIGYFMTFMMSFSNYSHGIMLLGCALMINGLFKLKAYNRFFLYPVFPLIPYILVEACFTARLASDVIGFPLPFITQTVSTAVEVVGYVACIVFHILLFKALISITSDLELDKQKIAAVRNRIFVCAYYALALFWLIPIEYNLTAKQIMTVLLLLLKLSFTVLDCILLYSCYAFICPQGDEDMPIRESGIEFIDNFRRETARKEQKAADERVRRYREYRDNRRIARQLRTNKPTGKKKK